MNKLHRSVVAIFCEDIREEAAGSNTIVGTLPDTITVQASTGLMPKLALYLRLAFDPYEVPRSVQYGIRFAGKDPFAEGGIDPDLIAKSAIDTQRAGTVVLSLIARMTAAPFPIEIGQLQAFVRLDGEDLVVGSLTFLLAEGGDEG